MKGLNTRVYIFLLSILACSFNFGQDSKNQWYIIQDTEDRIVYIDTSNIELTDDQLFTRVIIMYREPVFMHTQQGYVKKIKTHLLMNTEQNTYSVIGAIFYNAQDEVMGESADILSSGGSSNFSLKIQPNSVYELIRDKALEYLNTGRIKVDTGKYVKEKSEEILAKIPEKVQPVINKDSLAALKIKKDTVKTAALIKEPPAKEEEKETVKEPVKEIAVKIPPPVITKPKVNTAEKSADELKYDSTKDKVAKGLIFTDGQFFCFQVSSWKTKSIADREVVKLKRQGHNAFIVSAYIPSKKATWHRVRVGIFKSLKEAEAYQNKM